MPRIRAELMDAGVQASRKHTAKLIRTVHIREVGRLTWCLF